MNRFTKYRVGLVLSVLVSTPVWAVEAVFLELGKGDDTEMVRLALQWRWDKKWFADGDWHLAGSWDLSLANWRGKVGLDGSVTDIGITPLFRIQRNHPTSSGIVPYLELGIGAHYLFGNKINSKEMSTSFQFGDHIGIGMRFGAKREWDLGYRFQHLSNANIKTPNTGINVNILRLGYHFD